MFSKCPHCHTEVKTTNLDRHVQRVHGRRTQLPRSSSSDSGSNLITSHVASRAVHYGEFRLCVCDGSNDNCRYCYGTGRISTQSIASQTVAIGHPKPTPVVRVAKQPLVYLPPVENNNSIAPVSVRRPKPGRRPKIRMNSRATAETAVGALMKCPKCVLHVAKDRLAEHLDTWHEKNSNRLLRRPKPNGGTTIPPKFAVKTKPQPAVATHVNDPALTLCPVCNARVKRTKIERHLKNVHHSDGMKQTKVLLGKGACVDAAEVSRGGGVYDSVYESPWEARRMDHTRGYAHSFREQGKYGSHPSHDGFDDDSNP